MADVLIEPGHPLIAGKTLPFTFSFAKAGHISITVPIQTIGARRSGKGHG
jgi:copper(I)-binding protein